MIINEVEVNMNEIIKSEKNVQNIAYKIREITGCDYDVAERIAKEKRREYKRNESNSTICFVLGVLCILPMDFLSFLGTIMFWFLAYATYPRKNSEIEQIEKREKAKKRIEQQRQLKEEKYKENKENEEIQRAEIGIHEAKLINCPCCGKEISNMAEVCIHCGQPINSGVQISASSKNISSIVCPVCKSSNINVSVDNVAIGYKGETELRKKSVITNTANSAGRLGMIMMTGGLWMLTPKKSKYKEIQKGKTSYMKIKTCVCQNCGYSWQK